MRYEARSSSRAALRLAGGVLGVALLSGCTGPSHDPNAERVLRARRAEGEAVIAVPWPWSLRKEIRYGEGLEMAVAEVNARGGAGKRRLRLVRYDDRESIDEGRLIAQQIAGDPNVVAVIGHLQSYITVQAARVYDQAGLVLLAPTATAPELTELGFGRVFRATFTDESVGRSLADFAVERGFKKVAICYIRNTYGRNLANAFELRASQRGVTIVARDSYDSSERASERTFERIVREWSMADLDAILLAGEVPSAALFVAQARAQGIKVPIVGGDAMSSPGLMEIAGNAADGMVVASFFHPDEPRPEVARFVGGFERQFGVPPDAGSALGYDCVRLLAAAMDAAGSTVPDDVARALHSLRSWRGVTATFTFDERGDMPGRAIALSVVRGRRFEYLKPLVAVPPGDRAGGAPASLARDQEGRR